MADWHAIWMEFDQPLTPEQKLVIGNALHEEDYDFPRSALEYTDWVSYRSPLGGGSFIERICLEHGVEGRYWLVYGDPDTLQPEHRTDTACVVFRKGVDPDSVAKAGRERNAEAMLQRMATLYVAAARAFSCPPLPYRPEAAAALHITPYTDALTARLIQIIEEKCHEG